MNEHQDMRTIWQVASLIEDGATSEQIEVDLCQLPSGTGSATVERATTPGATSSGTPGTNCKWERAPVRDC